jgi:hypothetical protein
MVETRAQDQAQDGLFIVDLRRVEVDASRVSILRRRRVEEERQLRQFFRELGFYTQGGVVASKVYEKRDEKGFHRLYIEVYNAESHFNLVFTLTTEDVEELKQVARVLNALLEEESTLRGYERVV